MMRQTSEYRVRTRIAAEQLDKLVGKILTEDDYDMLMTGPTRIAKPDGDPLCVYLPRHLSQSVLDASYETLHSLRGEGLTDNRGTAGFRQVPPKREGGRTRATAARMRVSSAIIGAADPMSGFQYCRLTAWTGRELDRFQALQPLFKQIGDAFAEYVPDRHARQMQYVRHTSAEWVVPGTPFTTITVNNTYSTGVHTDKGDLSEGFSNLAVLRRGDWSGATFVFPEYRIGVNLQEGDLLLMDAHEFHGNTAMTCNACGEPMMPRMVDGTAKPGWHEECGSERISVVCYYRTRMSECGSLDHELAKARAQADLGTARGKRMA